MVRIDNLQPMCAVLLPPDDRLELALRESEGPELSSKRGKHE